jgi:hypothetical protein
MPSQAKPRRLKSEEYSYDRNKEIRSVQKFLRVFVLLMKITWYAIILSMLKDGELTSGIQCKSYSMDSEHESEDDFQNDDTRTEDGSERGDADEGNRLRPE